jgi:hypothetical protein
LRSIGTHYDFAALSTEDFSAKVTATVFEIVYRFCAPTVSVTCAPPSAFCLSNDVGAIKSLGTWTDAKGPDSIVVKDSGVAITFEAPSDALSVLLECADKAEEPTAQRVQTDFIITHRHPAGCPAKGGAGGGLSGGSLFLIILLVAVFVYVVAGCIWNVKRNSKPFGRESCPNASFWGALPGHTKAGCAFTFAKLRGLCGGKGSSGSAASEEAGSYGSV